MLLFYYNCYWCIIYSVYVRPSGRLFVRSDNKRHNLHITSLQINVIVIETNLIKIFGPFAQFYLFSFLLYQSIENMIHFSVDHTEQCAYILMTLLSVLLLFTSIREHFSLAVLLWFVSFREHYYVSYIIEYIER